MILLYLFIFIFSFIPLFADNNAVAQDIITILDIADQNLSDPITYYKGLQDIYLVAGQGIVYQKEYLRGRFLQSLKNVSSHLGSALLPDYYTLAHEIFSQALAAWPQGLEKVQIFKWTELADKKIGTFDKKQISKVSDKNSSSEQEEDEEEDFIEPKGLENKESSVVVKSSLSNGKAKSKARCKGTKVKKTKDYKSKKKKKETVQKISKQNKEESEEISVSTEKQSNVAVSASLLEAGSSASESIVAAPKKRRKKPLLGVQVLGGTQVQPAAQAVIPEVTTQVQEVAAPLEEVVAPQPIVTAPVP